MKKAVKIIVAALILTIGTGVCVFAGTQMENILVSMNAVHLEVDGVSVDAPNILYDGTTYVPLRRTAEILGKEVGWIPETNTATIYSKPGSNITPSKNIQTAALAVNKFVWLMDYGDDLYICYKDGYGCCNDYKIKVGNRSELLSGYFSRFLDDVKDFSKKLEDKDLLASMGQQLGLDFSQLDEAFQNYQNGIDCLNNGYNKIFDYEAGSSSYTLNEAFASMDEAFDYIMEGQGQFVDLYYSCIEYIAY